MISADLLAPGCAPLAGNKAAGELCTRPDGKTGFDDCGPGLFCTFWGQAQTDPPTRTCLPLCASDADCGAGTRCALVARVAYAHSMNPPSGGLCLATCDPYANDCAAGTQCTRFNLAADNRKALFTCHYPGKLGAGESCNPVALSQCAPGLDCIAGPNELGERCHALCDASHPCPEGKTCASDHYADQAGLGHCFN